MIFFLPMQLILMKSIHSLTPICFGIAALVATPFHSAQALNTIDISKEVMIPIEGQSLRPLNRTILSNYSESRRRNWIAQASTAEDWFKEGLKKQTKGDYRGAIADYDQAIALDPEHAVAYSNRGAIYYALGQYPQAIADYDQAIALNPEYAVAYSNRGAIYYTLGQYPQAIADYDQAIALNPEYAEALSNRAATYTALKQYPQAIAGYDQAIALDSEHAGAYLNRGITYKETGKIAQAKQDLQMAAKLFQQQNQPELYEQAMQLLQQL